MIIAWISVVDFTIRQSSPKVELPENNIYESLKHRRQSRSATITTGVSSTNKGWAIRDLDLAREPHKTYMKML